VYFPADANSLLVILEDCFKRKNGINVIVAGKQMMPQWLSIEEAREELKKGVGIWDWINPKHAENPDIVMAATGDALVQESMAAIKLLNKNFPEMKLRFVNVSELTALGVGDEKHPLSLGVKDFEKYFTADKPIIYNFHGYPGVIKKLIFGHRHAERFSIHGYMEEGTTTTPFEMMVFNKTSRYHLAIDACEKFAARHPALAVKARKVIRMCEKAIRDHERYIRKYGKDNPEVESWQ